LKQAKNGTKMNSVFMNSVVKRRFSAPVCLNGSVPEWNLKVDLSRDHKTNISDRYGQN